MRRLWPVVAAFLAACAPSVKSGEAVFRSADCASCHRVGSFGGGTGPDLTMVGFRRGEAWLDRWLSDPEAWKPGTPMPHPRLDESDRRAIAAYLAARRGPGTWSPASPGKEIYLKAGCVACHGVRGAGGHPNNNVVGGLIPALDAVVGTYAREELIAKIRVGATPLKADPEGPEPLVRMPAWGEALTDAEIGSVADYLFTLAPRKSEEW